MTTKPLGIWVRPLRSGDALWHFRRSYRSKTLCGKEVSNIRESTPDLSFPVCEQCYFLSGEMPDNERQSFIQTHNTVTGLAVVDGG